MPAVWDLLVHDETTHYLCPVPTPEGDDRMRTFTRPLDLTERKDIRDTDWYQFSEEIDHLLLEVGSWAKDELIAIQNAGETSRAVTQEQRAAVLRVRRAGERSVKKRTGRSYLGFIQTEY